MSIEHYNIFGASFEEQFARREEIETAGGTASVIDVGPEHPKSDIPIFLAPSWSVTVDTYEPLIKMLVEKDRKVVSFNHPRIGGDMSDAEKLGGEYPKNELRKALTILDILDAKSLDVVDALTHSESAINTTIAAMIHPEKFRSIIYYAPAGMIGEDTFSRLFSGFSKQSDHSPTLDEMNLPERTKDSINILVKESIKYIAKNPIRSITEATDISKSQIHDMIRTLHEKGIHIAVMSAVDDPVFPAEKMQEIAKADMLDGYLSIRGGHAISTEGPLFGQGIEEVFSKLEKLDIPDDNQIKEA